MRNFSITKIITPLLLALLTGCLGTVPPTTEFAPVDAHQLLTTIDHTIATANIRDAATQPIPDVPWLRIDRLQQALRPLAVEQDQRLAWLSRSYRLARETRAREIRNLPTSILQQLLTLYPSAKNRVQLQLAAVRAADKLFTANRDKPALWQHISSTATVPDNYAGWMRWFGYPLVALPVKLLGDAAFSDFIAWHKRTDAELPESDTLIAYRSGETSPQIDLTLMPRDTLGLIFPTDEDLKRLAKQYAPILIQETTSEDDRIGALLWQDTQLSVATDQPTSYYYLSHALVGTRPLPQLNYVFWYPARSGAASPWIERGRFDGLTIRITLSDDGEILMTDIMNNCGCYHFFLPAADLLSHPKQVIGINPLTPRLLPESAMNQLPMLRIMSGWHQVEHLYEQAPKNVGQTVSYQLRPYSELESLPRGNDTHASAFDTKGILKGSERIEPYVLFAMGVPEVGAMRQRGNHPITLIGREHFDNPRLFERSFELKPQTPFPKEKAQ